MEWNKETRKAIEDETHACLKEIILLLDINQCQIVEIQRSPIAVQAPIICASTLLQILASFLSMVD
jgi:hypothetical protein